MKPKPPIDRYGFDLLAHADESAASSTAGMFPDASLPPAEILAEPAGGGVDSDTDDVEEYDDTLDPCDECGKVECECPRTYSGPPFKKVTFTMEADGNPVVVIPAIPGHSIRVLSLDAMVGPLGEVAGYVTYAVDSDSEGRGGGFEQTGNPSPGVAAAADLSLTEEERLLALWRRPTAGMDDLRDAVAPYKSRIAALEAALAEAVEIMKPFTHQEDQPYPHIDGGTEMSPTVTAFDLRRAAAFVDKCKKGTG